MRPWTLNLDDVTFPNPLLTDLRATYGTTKFTINDLQETQITAPPQTRVPRKGQPGNVIENQNVPITQQKLCPIT